MCIVGWSQLKYIVVVLAMDVNDDNNVKQNKTQHSNIKSIFQRGFKSKSAGSGLECDPVELQRVSFATSIDQLPERPSAFKQVLRQIGTSRNNLGGNKMKRVHSFKKLSKDRSNSPQGRLSVTSTSSSAPNNLEVNPTRPRSSSSSSFTPTSDVKPLNFNDDLSLTTREPRSSMDSVHQAKTNEIQPIVAPLLMTTASDVSYDAVDGSPGVSEAQRNRQLVEHIQQKILKISEAIKLEQSTRDENVGDYLKLAGNADKQQVARIKSVFEKKNQKSNAAIAQLKKKFDTYHRRLREIESSGAVGRQSKSLRDVGANLRDFSGGVVDSVKGGLSGLQQATQNAAGAIASKPKDLASKLKNKFGSADNLSSLKYEEGGLEDTSLDYRYTSADDVSSTSSIDIGLSINHDEHVVHNSILSGPDSPHSGLRRVDPQYMQAIINQVAGVKSDLVSTQVAHQQFEVEWEDWKRLEQNTIDLLTRSLQEERFRCERLEVQLNDLTELHQREVTNLKQELFSMEEKVEYHASERARDMQEAIESCQTRLAKMELQQQQLVSVDGLENATARALLGKLINLLLSVMAVLLVLVSTVSGLLKPLTKSPVRVISTVVVIISIIIAYKTWDTIPMMSSMMSSR
uniref:transmembrane and coiled-coil domains protein 1-like isoform X2 n=1 Tax=Ciona intestinalis TaxID=7719 RepID=UPI0005212DD6|nr:transmembrane and coiled-coil domains protein 1-like isoform X2 [Ciona intestinalis]|eukprot:XP_002127059.3 transmembrane and coiled-coil domains protein 1-like isoform X2 [Ciona intestinalis]